jgi:hypothetical protein
VLVAASNGWPLAAIATLIAASVAAVASVVTAVVSARSNRTTERDRWARQEIAPLYARFLLKAKDLKVVADHLAYLASSGDIQQVQDDTNEPDGLFAKMLHDLSERLADLELTGSLAANAAAREVLEGGYGFSLTVSHPMVLRRGATEMDHERVRDALDSIQEPLDQFLRVARRDLRSSD